jgi:hypothetical protein
LLLPVRYRVARFFLTKYTKAVENAPDCH